MNELLLMAKEKGKSIFISYYEVHVDHVYDLLDPKRPTVLVLDNGHGKIQLKGLSQASYSVFAFVSKNFKLIGLAFNIIYLVCWNFLILTLF